MMYRILIFIVVIISVYSCQHRNVYYEISMENISNEAFKERFNPIDDTNQIKLLNAILNTGGEFISENPDIEYFSHRDFSYDPCIVVKIDDYFVREYAVWNDYSYVELSYEGGDGPYYSKGYSYRSKDSLVMYKIEEVWSEDEELDTTLNESIIDTIKSITMLNGKKMPRANKLSFAPNKK